MATQVQFRRGTTAETAAFTGALGEVTVDITKDVVVVHDGSTPGGYPSLRQDGVNSALQAGSLSSPALKFANSTTTGFYSPSSGTIGLVASGILALSTDTAGNLSTNNTFTATGRITTSSSFAFATTSTAPTNGLYLSAANTVSIATNGSARLSVDGSGNLSVTGGLTLGGSFGALNFVPSGTSTAAATVNGLFLKSSSPATLALAAGSNEVLTINNSGNLSITGGFTIGGSFSATNFVPTSSTVPTNGMYLSAANTLAFATNSTFRLAIGPTGDITTTGGLSIGGAFSSASFAPTGSTAPTNGLYLPSANTLGLSTNSAQRLTIDATGNVTVSTGSLTVSSGTVTAQSFIPSSATVPTNGMYLSAANTLSFATSSTVRLTIGTTGNVSISGTGTLSVPGTTTSASFIPTSSSIPTNGMYLSAANTLGFATNSGIKMSLDATGNLTLTSGNLTVSTGNTIIPLLRLTGSSSGYVELIAPAAAASNRLTLPNGNGSAGQVLSTDGTGILSWAAASGITQGTAQSLTGLTTYSFTGLPSTVKRILISIYNLSTNSNSEIMIRLIVGGTPVTSGYLGSANSGVFTAGFTDNVNNSAAVRQGSLIISQHSSTVWAASGALARSDLGAQTPIAGTVSISGTVTGILITTLVGIATFDAGSEVNILYES